jgi:hypothetical protein
MRVLHLVLARTWWSYDPGSTWYWAAYHWFNLVEGSVWLVFAALVWRRCVRYRNSPLEVLYGLAFLTFGLSDYREAYVVQSWLILFKGVNLAALLYLRWIVMRRFYPHSKTY